MKKLNLDQCLENDPNLLQKLSAQNIESIHTDLDLFRSVIDVGQRRASKSVCNWASNIIDCTMGQSNPGSCPSKVVYDGFEGFHYLMNISIVLFSRKR